MKKIKKIVVLFTVALLCLLPILSNPLTVQAEGNPTTYYVKYVTEEGQWRLQYGTWVDGDKGRDLYYLKEGIKDGDLLVIDGNESIDLQVNVKLSNLTVVNSTLAIISATSIDDVYVINNSTASVTGDVTNAYVYNSGVANFNTNVANLYIINTNQNDDPDANVAVIGTTGYVKGTDANSTYYEGYNFKANTLRIENGHLTTASENFSTTPSAAPSAPAATTTPAAGTTTTTTSSSSEYDDVPKTGDPFVNPLLFLGIAVVCLAGSYELKRR